MNHPGINAITLPEETVMRAVEAWLNLHVLRTPHVITSIEFDDEVYSIGLAPEPSAEPAIKSVTWTYPEIGVTTTPPIISLIEDCYAATNGNGHQPAAESVGAGLVPALAQSERQEAAPVTQAAPKKRARGRLALTPEDIAAIQALHEKGVGPTQIGKSLGLGRSTVSRYLGLIRRGAHAAEDAPATAGGPQATDGGL